MAAALELPDLVASHITKMLAETRRNLEIAEILECCDFSRTPLLARFFDINSGEADKAVIDFSSVYQVFFKAETKEDEPGAEPGIEKPDLIWQYWDWIGRNAEALMPFFDSTEDGSLKTVLSNSLVAGISHATDQEKFRDSFNTAWDSGTLKQGILKALLVHLTTAYVHSNFCKDDSLPHRVFREPLDNELASFAFAEDAEGRDSLTDEFKCFLASDFKEVPVSIRACRDHVDYGEKLRNTMGLKMLMRNFLPGYDPVSKPGEPPRSLETLILNLKDPSDMLPVLPLLRLPCKSKGSKIIQDRFQQEVQKTAKGEPSLQSSHASSSPDYRLANSSLYYRRLALISVSVVEKAIESSSP